MAKRHGSLSSTRKTAHPPKTKKRRAIKHAMLAARLSAQAGKTKKSK